MNLAGRPIQTNFTSGELSPRLKGRVDLEQYGAGAATLLNVMVLPAGGVTRRPGSGFVALSKTPNQRVRLIPFTVSDLTAYVIEAGHGYFRFHRNRGPVMDGGGVPVEVATPYAFTELRDIGIDQSADVLYLAHPAHPPLMLSRTGPVTFTLTGVPFANGPYDVENTGDVGAPGGPDAVVPPPATTAPTTVINDTPDAPAGTEAGGQAGGQTGQSGQGDPGGDGGGGQGGGDPDGAGA